SYDSKASQAGVDVHIQSSVVLLLLSIVARKGHQVIDQPELEGSNIICRYDVAAARQPWIRRRCQLKGIEVLRSHRPVVDHEEVAPHPPYISHSNRQPRCELLLNAHA